MGRVYSNTRPSLELDTPVATHTPTVTLKMSDNQIFVISTTETVQRPSYSNIPTSTYKIIFTFDSTIKQLGGVLDVFCQHGRGWYHIIIWEDLK